MSNYALLVLDIQNDLCHEEGVYSKNGLSASNVSPIIPNLIEVMHFCHKHAIPIIATQLTILTNAKKQPIGMGQLKLFRPFLEKEGFREGTWGHDIIDGLPKIDYSIRKWTLSPFFNTELDHYLNALGTKNLILTGFTTNGVVESTAREAIGRNLQITTLTDCVASYSEVLHQASLTNLGAFGQIHASKEWFENFKEISA